MKLTRMLLLCSLALAVVAQVPVVIERFNSDPQLGSQAGLKVENKATGRRVLVVDGGLWGIDENSRVRFQLLTDGSLRLYNQQGQNTILLDAENGELLLRDATGALRIAATARDGRIATSSGSFH